MPVDITPMIPDDFDSVTALWKRSSGVGLNESDRRERITLYLERNPGMSMVARSAGVIVGAVLCGHDGRRGYLHHLAVDVDCRRTGIGRALVDRCMVELGLAGIDRCNIFLYADNELGMRFWTNHGWYARDLKVLSAMFRFHRNSPLPRTPASPVHEESDLPSIPATSPFRLRRFLDLGLRWNPFRIADADECLGFYVPDPRLPFARAAEIARSPERFTQIIGDAGWGKSTLLNAVKRELSTAGIDYQHDYLSPQGPFVVEDPQPSIRHLLIDEAQRLSRRGRRSVGRWLQRGNDRRVIVTTHENLHKAFPERPLTIELPAVHAERLLELFERRIQWAGGDPSLFEFCGKTADWLIARCRGNLRSMELVLYEFFQHAEPAERIVIDGLEPLALAVEPFFLDHGKDR